MRTWPIVVAACILLSPASGSAQTGKVPVQQAQAKSGPDGKSGGPDQCCKEEAQSTNLIKQVRVNARKFTVTGEVVDTWCFASKAVLTGRGPEHYKCADACAHGGVTLGIVDDKGTLYIAAKTKAYQGCQHLLEPFVARRVIATGWLSQAGGCNVMKIDKIQLATDKPQPKLPGVK